MCRLMIADGASPEKVWIKGGLHPPSANQPTCKVGWRWHVAPTLQVNTTGGIQTWVIDPALFTGPIDQATWKSVQLDPNAVLKASGADMFYYGTFLGYPPDQFDPMYANSNAVMTTYRNELKLRSVGASGPPPYLSCMTPAPRVQWRAQLGPNQTQTWFTWGWGASWHVVWTIMPLTPCPGANQLRWKVRVERASGGQSTYWIMVTNLSGDPVSFEGRYDVLSW
jgi:hypothetical protein